MAFLMGKGSTEGSENNRGTGYASSPEANLDVPLTGPVDPSLNFVQPPVIRSSRPEGISTLREWGNMQLPEGKWKNATFAEVFNKDQQYVMFMANHRKLVSPWALSFKSYVLARLKAQKEHEEMKQQMAREMEQKVREVLMSGALGSARPSQLDWELISQSMHSTGTSPRGTGSRLKRSVEEEFENNKITPEYDQETKTDKVMRMAILQRELDRLKEEIEEP